MYHTTIWQNVQERQQEEAVKILQDDREKLDGLSRCLYEKEAITGEDFMTILNR